jgi:WD40 repeat protein
MNYQRISAILIAVALASVFAIDSATAQTPIPIAAVTRDSPVSFESDVLPIFRKSCLACHSATERQGDLVLESPQSILKGGDSGPAVAPGRGADSLLMTLASHSDEPFMPPPKNDVAAKPLTSQELGLIKLWIDQGAKGTATSSVPSPKQWRPLPPGVNPIYAVAVTADGQYAACGRANQIFIYHVASGQLVTRLTDPALQSAGPDPRPGVAHLDLVQSLAFNPEGDMLASGGFREVKLWRRPRDVQRFQLAAAQDVVTAVAVRPDGKLLATGAADNSIKLWDLATGQPGLTLAGHAAAISSLQFSQDGTKLWSGSADKTIRVWNTADGTLLGRIDTPASVNAITLVAAAAPVAPPEGEQPVPPIEHVVTGGADNFVRLWKSPADLSPPLADVPAKPDVLAVSADRKLLAVANAEGTVRVVEFDTGKLIHTWKAHEAAIAGMAFRAELPAAAPAQAAADQPVQPPVRQLATCGADNTVRVWNMDSGEASAVLRGTLAPVQSVAFHPEGKQLVAGAADGSVTVWNLESPPPRPLAGDNGGAATVAAVSPDGKLLATSGTASGLPAILVRELASGAITHTLLGHESPVIALAFSADNTKVASGSADKTARVWDLSDDKFPELSRFAEHTAPVSAVAFSADGTQVLSGSADNSVKLWTTADGKSVQDFAGHTAAVVAVAFGPGNLPISASADKTVRFWNVADGKQARAITATVAISSMSITRDSARLAVAGADNSIKLHQTSDGAVVQTLVGHQKPVTSLVFSADNARLVSGAADNAAIVWETATGRLLEIVPVDAGLSVAAYAADSNTLALGASDGNLALHTLHFGAALTGMTQKVTAVAYNSNGQMIYTVSADGTVRGFNTANSQQAFSANHGAPVHGLSLSPNGLLLASAGEDKLVKLWNAANGAAAAPPQFAGFNGPVHGVCFSTDSTKVIAGGGAADQDISVFDIAAGVLEQTFTGHTAAIAALTAAGESGDRIVSASADGTVRAWQLLALRRIPGHSQPVTSLASIPGSPMQVLSGSDDGTMRRWSLENGQQLVQINHGAPVTSVAVRPDAQRFASTSSNNTVRLWNAQNGQQLAEMRGDIRAKSLVAGLTQQVAAAKDTLKTATDTLTAAETALPTKTAAAKTASDALTAANKAVDEKVAALKVVADAKAAAEKVAIEAAAAAQKAALAKAMADQAAIDAAAEAKAATEFAARATAAAQSAPDDKTLAAAAQAAQTAIGATTAKAQAATAAKAAPEKAAADAAAAANDAATKALATGKPFTDAATALEQAQAAQNAAAAASALAAREAEDATAAVPAAKTAVTSADAAVKQLETDLAAATKDAAAAEQPLRAVAFSPDNRQLVTGGDFGAVHAWDADNGAAVASYAGHSGPIRSVAYTADGGLATASADKTAAVWELNPNWVLERQIGNITDPSLLVHRVITLDFSPDGQLLCTGGGEPSRSGEIKIWKVADGSLVRAIPDPHTDTVISVRFSRDGKLLASGGADKYVRSFNVATGKQVRSYEGHTHHILGVSWRADGNVLATAGADNVIKVWNTRTADQIRTIAGFNKQVTALRFVGNTDNFVACAADKNVRLLNAGNGGTLRNFAGATDFMYSIDVTPNGQVVVAGGHDSVLRIWNGDNAQVIQSLAPPQEPTVAAAAK